MNLSELNESEGSVLIRSRDAVGSLEVLSPSGAELRVLEVRTAETLGTNQSASKH
jgi:hypothetical protein